MSAGARKMRDFYAIKKNAPVYQREFCFFVLDKWKADIQNAVAGAAAAAAAEEQVICANLVGGYMYLRSLIGPLELMYMFHDDPKLIHRCMEAWFILADAVYAEMQKETVFDEVFLIEDICYNHGLLISPELVREFLFPYYHQLISNVKSRQLDKSRALYLQVDTDGFSDVAIPLYMELGLDYLSPFEVPFENYLHYRKRMLEFA
jgi:uroporphyrinogen decarboxylase